MLPSFEYVAIGAVLLAAGAVCLARAAVYFRATDTGADRFFSTSFTSVLIIALLVGGVLYLARAVFDVEGAGRLVAALAAIAYTAVIPLAIWRWIGPRHGADAVRAAA